MSRLEAFVIHYRPSFRVYFLIAMAGIMLHVRDLFVGFVLAGYFVFEPLDKWIARLRRERAHESVMDIFQPDPDNPGKELNAKWYWDDLSRGQAIVLTRMTELIRRIE